MRRLISQISAIDLTDAERGARLPGMILTRSLEAPYRTVATDGRFQIGADTHKLGRGGDGGLRPHQLLEAALATCMNISVRLEAQGLGAGPVEVRTAVQLDRSRPGEAAYHFRFRIDGDLTAPQREALEATARSCLLGQTLRRAVSLVEDLGLEVAP
jgi:putative redox protein